MTHVSTFVDQEMLSKQQQNIIDTNKTMQNTVITEIPRLLFTKMNDEQCIPMC